MTTMTRTLRRVGAVTTSTVLLTGGLVITPTAALAADTTTVPLKGPHKGAAATAFAGGSECAGYSSAQTLWHFVVPALDASPKSTGPDIVGIVAIFAPASSYSSVVVQNGKGIDVFTTGSTTVTDATAMLNAGIPTEDAVLVLSHTCLGSGTTGGDTGGTTGGNTTGATTGGATGATSGTTTGTTGGTTGDTTGGTTGTAGGTSGGSTTGSSTTGSSTTGSSTTGTTGAPSTGSTGAVGTTGDTTVAPPVVTPAAPVVVPTSDAPEAAPATAPQPAAPITGGAGGAATATVGGTSATTGAATVAAPGTAAPGTATALPFTGAPVGRLPLYGFAALLLGVLLLVGGRERNPAALRAGVYRGRHAQPSVLDVVLRVVAGLTPAGARVR